MKTVDDVCDCVKLINLCLSPPPQPTNVQLEGREGGCSGPAGWAGAAAGGSTAAAWAGALRLPVLSCSPVQAVGGLLTPCSCSPLCPWERGRHCA